MRELRIFAREHAADAANLFLRVMRRPDARESPPRLQDYFCEIFLQNPWVAEDLPSWICYEAGVAIGFLGIVPRPMLFCGKPVRAAIASQFMVDRKRHRGPAAIEMMNRLFKGPQDLSYTDGAAEEAHMIWAGMGAHAASTYSFNWLRPLRPLQTLRTYAGRGGRLLMTALSPLEYALARAPIAALRQPESEYASEPATVEELFRCIAETGWREPLKPAYEEKSFRWLISQAASGKRLGDLHAAIVRAPDGAPAGWYVYMSKAGGPAWVLQIGTRRQHDFDPVLRALFRDAWKRGASSVKGQAIPQHLVELTKQYCLFRHPTTSVLFHSRNKDIVDVIYRGKAALSRLDGESWMRFALESWIDSE